MHFQLASNAICVKCYLCVTPTIELASKAVVGMHQTHTCCAVAGLTKLELNTIAGPTAPQYDDMLQSMDQLQHLHVIKVTHLTC